MESNFDFNVIRACLGLGFRLKFLFFHRLVFGLKVQFGFDLKV